MKIGVIADTHNKRAITEAAVQILRDKGAEALFHCGDLLNEEILIVCSALSPFYFVAGNNDPSQKQLQILSEMHSIHFLGRGGVICLGGYTIAVAHGHDKATVKTLLAADPNYLLLGHSHVRRDQRLGKTRVINPGALHRSASKSCALIDLAADTVETILMDG